MCSVGEAPGTGLGTPAIERQQHWDQRMVVSLNTERLSLAPWTAVLWVPLYST